MTGPMTQNQLDAALDFILQTTKDTTNFVVEQAPLVAQEIVAWEFYGAACATLVCGLLAAIAAGFGVRFVRTALKPETCDDDGQVFFGIGLAALLVSCVLTGPTIYNAMRMVKTTVAPRLVVIEYIRGVGK